MSRRVLRLCALLVKHKLLAASTRGSCMCPSMVEYGANCAARNAGGTPHSAAHSMRAFASSAGQLGPEIAQVSPPIILGCKHFTECMPLDWHSSAFASMQGHRDSSGNYRNLYVSRKTRHPNRGGYIGHSSSYLRQCQRIWESGKWAGGNGRWSR